jgi:hypothetical protein
LPNNGGLGTPIGSAHYDLWAANFGDMAPGSGSGPSAAAAPEPTSFVLGIRVLMGVALHRRRA